MRNPLAFGKRILANIKTMPNLYLEAFGKRLGLMLGLMVPLGV